jgi:anti-sigma B factor antagonist
VTARPDPQRPTAGPVVSYAGPPTFACFVYDAGEIVRVIVSGELDLVTVPQLEAALLGAQQRSRDVVLDLRRLDFMDCSGLSVLDAAATRAREVEERFRVVRGPPNIDRLFALTALDLVLDLISGDEA